ncbi:MAG: hypothetical protein NTV43_01690 [Methylococcales bacterium]|nr:hypothetical protein [Methylococcales bacterium]
MATSKPGPLGVGTNKPVIDKGTMALTNSPLPGPIGIDANLSVSIKSRPLTSGEINMAYSLFRDSIDYFKVRVHNEDYLWFGLQDDDTAMTPNGEMYFNPKHFKLDFSVEFDSYKLWFIHEMGHVWQFQLGYGVKLAGLTTDYNNKNTYQYDIATDATKTLADFNFEQQCELFKDYYAAKFLGIDPLLDKKNFLDNVLHDFLKNPKNEKLLPK